jgi:Rrf2 family protein
MADIAGKIRSGASVVSTRSIAESQGISENYLEQILSQLKEHGLVKSVRGAGGGFKLTKPPDEITAGEILRAVEGSLSPAECLDEPDEFAGDGTVKSELANVKASRTGSSRSGCTSCDDCTAKGVLSKVYGSVTEVVDSITVLDIIDNKQT